MSVALTVEDDEVVAVPLVLLVDPLFGCSAVRGVNATETLCPGRIPRSRRRSTLAVTTCTWSSTSGLALSMSRMIFEASARRSGVSRITMAFCAFTGCTRRKSNSWQSGHDLGQVLRRDRVRQIERADFFVFHVLALLRRVRRDENHAAESGFQNDLLSSEISSSASSSVRWANPP